MAADRTTTLPGTKIPTADQNVGSLFGREEEGGVLLEDPAALLVGAAGVAGAAAALAGREKGETAAKSPAASVELPAGFDDISSSGRRCDERSGGRAGSKWRARKKKNHLAFSVR